MRRRMMRLTSSLITWLTNALFLQILLSLATTPFLLAWKLPYTPLSLLGNLIFPVFLISFLGVSSLFFAATLLGLPTTVLEYLLTIIHSAWSTALSWHPPLWWFRIQWWHLLPACLLGTGMWIWRYTVFPQKVKARTFFSCILLSVYFLFQGYALTPAPTKSILQRGKYTLTFTPLKDGTLTLYDRGYISHAGNIDAIIDYEVMPHIIATYGHPSRIQVGAYHIGTRLKKAQQILKEWGL